MFYRVNKFYGTGSGINPTEVGPLLTPGRVIRWRSSGAEYGLIEATVVKSGDPMRVRDTSKSREGEIYIEQVAEVKLTQAEAQERGFGWPE